MEARRLEEIACAHGVVLLLQFGSTVSGRQHPRSDVDLAVLINRADPFFLKKITEDCRLL